MSESPGSHPEDGLPETPRMASDAAMEALRNRIGSQQAAQAPIIPETSGSQPKPEQPAAPTAETPSESLSDRLQRVAQQQEAARLHEELLRRQKAEQEAARRAAAEAAKVRAEKERAQTTARAKAEAVSTAAELARLLKAADKTPDTPVITDYRTAHPTETKKGLLGILGIPRIKEVEKREPIRSNVWIVNLKDKVSIEKYTPGETGGLGWSKMSDGEKGLLEEWRTYTTYEGFGLNADGHLMRVTGNDRRPGLVARELDFGSFTEVSEYESLIGDLEKLGARLLYS